MILPDKTVLPSPHLHFLISNFNAGDRNKGKNAVSVTLFQVIIFEGLLFGWRAGEIANSRNRVLVLTDLRTEP